MSVNPPFREVVRQEWGKRQPRRPKPNRDGFPESVKQIVTHRSAGMCELDFCGPAEVIHHRRPRGSGGTSLDWVNRAANGFHVSSACHDQIEGRLPAWSRRQSTSAGWLVSQNGARDAAESPVLYRGRWVLLADDGSVLPAPIEGVTP